MGDDTTSMYCGVVIRVLKPPVLHICSPSTREAPNVQEISPGPKMMSAFPRHKPSSIRDAKYNTLKQYWLIETLLSSSHVLEHRCWAVSQIFVKLDFVVKFSMLYTAKNPDKAWYRTSVLVLMAMLRIFLPVKRSIIDGQRYTPSETQITVNVKV